MGTLHVDATTTPTYALGHAPEELRRLERQAEVLRPATRRTLELAGIGSGMRVLDLGTGTGDVARLAAELVGPTGRVVGVDRSEEALAAAEAISRTRGVTTIHLVAGDLHTTPLEGLFDAVVGRFVLMHLPDPEAALRRAATLVRPGGILAFVEPVCLDQTPMTGEAPLMARTTDLIWTGLRLAGRDLAFGLRLPGLPRSVGATAPGFVAEGVVVSTDDPSFYAWPVETLRSLLPLLERAGVTSRDELDLDTLEDRMAAEARREGASVMPQVICGSWVRTAA